MSRYPDKQTGLIIHHDPRNEKFLFKASLQARGVDLFRPKTIKHRQYTFFNQGYEPSCTGFGSVTLLATARPYNKPPLTGAEWYALNQLYDRKKLGLNFVGGATVTAAMEVGRALGFYQEYRWMYTIRAMQEAILKGALIAGTWWYPSMFDRSAEGVVRSPGPNEQADSGHLYVINGYDKVRDLWRIPNTWGDGYYYFPGELMYRLVREEGEIAQPVEIKSVTKVLDFKKRLDELTISLKAA